MDKCMAVDQPSDDIFEYVDGDMDHLVQLMSEAARQREQQQQGRPASVPTATWTPAPTRSSSPDQSTNIDFVPVVKEIITSSRTAAMTDALQQVSSKHGS
jgi:hypothetical protein